MGIISVDRNATVDYVPEYFDNRNSDNPTVIGIKPLDHKGVKAYTKKIAVGVSNSPGTPSDITKVNARIAEEQFLAHVVYIENFTIQKDKGESVVLDKDDVQTFYDKADAALINEINLAMETHSILTQGQLKNSVGVSDTDLEVKEEKPPLSASLAVKESNEKTTA